MDTSRPASSRPPGPQVNRSLLVLLAVLAAACGALAVGWAREHQAALHYRKAADCLRSIAEEDRVPQDRECPP